MVYQFWKQNVGFWRHKVLVSFLLFFAVVITTFSVRIPVALAANGTSLSASVGFSGYFAEDDWVPVTLRISHQGPAESAVLKVSINQSMGNNTNAIGTFQWPIELPANQNVIKQISLPGDVVNGAEVDLVLYNGNRIASTFLSGNALGHVALVSVISDSLQTAAYWTGSSDGVNPVQPVVVSLSTFPETAGALGGIRAVAASPDLLAKLSQAQTEALITWVQLGGLLVVTGTHGTASDWRGILPIKPGKEEKVSADGLGAFTNTIPPSGNLMVAANGISRSAEEWASEGNTPLIASRLLGRGEIWQTSFSPNEGTLLAWSGNPALWTTILRNSTLPGQSALVKPLSPNGVLSLTSVRDALSPMRVPSLKFWAMVFLLYLLVIGPLLFTWLRKSGRAAWAWFFLPSIALVVTVGMYTFGLAIRPPGLLNEAVGVLELTGNGIGQAYSMQALMSPFRNQMTFALPPGTFALTLEPSNSTNLNTNLITHEANHTLVSFGTSPRWSVRYLYAVDTLSKQGSLSCTLSSSFGLLLGAVTNNTPYPLHDVALFWQGRLYNLGNFSPGQTKSVDRAVESAQNYSNWLFAYSNYNHTITHSIGRSLIQFVSSENWTDDDSSGNMAMLIASTSARIPTLPMVSNRQKVASAETLVLIRQYTTVSTDSGGPFV
ncbi:fumarylacetoacetate hydrolase family protein [Alicyclobacillus sp. TC]|uniref:hypothetical protein n=1 Tax=Alicyclobacillus sp. TC TaxID=2606450 RepID=UPI0019320975|nr:hypothetical protein [Alicyclobacillus sp. TC]QRF23072.1 fumarylacetoacetate hydrolase family protein [Alicyclobacillus sp. TC]